MRRMCDRTYMFSSPKLQTCSAKYGVILSVFVPMDQVRQNTSVTVRSGSQLFLLLATVQILSLNILYVDSRF